MSSSLKKKAAVMEAEAQEEAVAAAREIFSEAFAAACLGVKRRLFARAREEVEEGIARARGIPWPERAHLARADEEWRRLFAFRGWALVYFREGVDEVAGRLGYASVDLPKWARGDCPCGVSVRVVAAPPNRRLLACSRLKDGAAVSVSVRDNALFRRGDTFEAGYEEGRLVYHGNAV